MINFERVGGTQTNGDNARPVKSWESIIKAYQRNQDELMKISRYKPCNDTHSDWEKAERKLLADQYRLIDVASNLPINDHQSALQALLLWEFENKGIEGSEDSYPLIESVKNFIKTQA